MLNRLGDFVGNPVDVGSNFERDTDELSASDRKHEIDGGSWVVSSRSDIGANAYDRRTEFECVATLPGGAGIGVRAVKDSDDGVGTFDLANILFEEQSWIEWFFP
jgi:hypothetical protein